MIIDGGKIKTDDDTNNEYIEDKCQSEPQAPVIDKDEWNDHFNHARKTIESWPKWKRDIAEDYFKDYMARR